ncbi:MAG: hypothetical protein WDZ38_00065 [Balneolaceae bacterium]
MAVKKKKKGKSKSVEKADFWESLNPSKQHFIILAFLFILPLFLFHSSILGGQQYMGHDTIQWRAGAESLIQHQEQADETAHWATNMFSGMPATTISHPPQIKNLDNTVLRFLRVIYPAAEMWILLGGAYLMFLLMGARPLSALFGAIIIGFTTYIPIIIGAGHNAKFLAYIYIPWLYNGYFLLTRTKLKWNRWAAFFIFALALTLHLRAYHPQVTYFFLFPLGSLFIVDLIRAIRSESSVSKTFYVQTGWLTAAAIVAILITVQLYWSTFEYSSFSMRGGSELTGAGGLERDYAFGWSQGWAELLTLLIPGAFGGSELYWGPKSFTSGPHYAGVLTFLFFVMGVLKSKHVLKWVFLGPGIATLLFSLGEHFGGLNNLMFGYFPLFDKFRVPEMWLMITVFCFSVPAVFGLDWVIDQVQAGKKMKALKKPLGITAAIGLLVIFTVFQLLSFEKQGERSQIAEKIAGQNDVPVNDPRVSQAVSRVMQTQLIPEREELAQADSLRFAIFFVLGFSIIIAMAMRKLPVSYGMVALSALLAYDLIQIDSRYLSENSLVDQSISREEVIEQNERPLDRFIQEQITDEEGWPYRVFPLLDNPFNNAVPSYFYPTIGGYSGAKLGYYQDLIDEAIFLREGGLNTAVISMLNVKYLTLDNPAMVPGFEVVYNGEDGTVLENRNVLPKAFFVDSVSVLQSQTDVLRQISSGFDASEVAYLSEGSGRVGDVDRDLTNRPDSSSTAMITHYDANQISIEIERTEPGFLVLSEIWYPPGWSAELNGDEIEIIRTNYVLRGFHIPAGDHTLILKLEPVWFRIGHIFALVGTVLLFGSGFFGLFIVWKRRDQNLPDQPE